MAFYSIIGLNNRLKSATPPTTTAVSSLLWSLAASLASPMLQPSLLPSISRMMLWQRIVDAMYLTRSNSPSLHEARKNVYAKDHMDQAEKASEHVQEYSYIWNILLRESKGCQAHAKRYLVFV